jgi:hypothetical protein
MVLRPIPARVQRWGPRIGPGVIIKGVFGIIIPCNVQIIVNSVGLWDRGLKVRSEGSLYIVPISLHSSLGTRLLKAPGREAQ